MSNKHGNPVFSLTYSVPNSTEKLYRKVSTVSLYASVYLYGCWDDRIGKTVSVKTLLQQA